MYTQSAQILRLILTFAFILVMFVYWISDVDLASLIYILTTPSVRD